MYHLLFSQNILLFCIPRIILTIINTCRVCGMYSVSLLIFFPIPVLLPVSKISISIINLSRWQMFVFLYLIATPCNSKRYYTEIFPFNLILFLKGLYFLHVSVRSAQRPRSVSKRHYYYGETCVGRDRSYTIPLSRRACHVLLSQHGQHYHFKFTNGCIR